MGAAKATPDAIALSIHPLQTGEVHVHGEEARVARQAVHLALIVMVHVGPGRGQGLRGRAVSRALSALAGCYGD